MAGLIINDPYGGGQELISSGRSSIPLRETYSTDPRAINAQYSDSMRNVNSLVDALSGLAKTIGSVEEQNKKNEAANAEAYVADVYGKLNSTDPVDKQLASLRPDLNPWTRAAMSQIIARQQAQTAAQNAIENMPVEARATPEATQAYFDEFYRKEAQRTAGQPFFTSPYLGALREAFGRRSGQLSAERTTVMTEAMRQDGRTQQYNAMESFLKSGRLPVDPSKAPNPEEASEVVAFAQKYGISPVSATMMLQMLERQATPDTSIIGETAQKRPMQEQIAQLERVLVAKGIRQGARFEDLYAAVNPNGNMREDVRTFLPSAAAALGLPFDERNSTLGGISPQRRPSQPAGPVDDAFSVNGVPIRHSFDPAATYGRSASANAQRFSNIVLHHAVGTTDSLVKYGQREDAVRGGAFGYHFYIDPDGTIVQGAPMSKRTNHVKPEGAPQRREGITGVENNNSIGITLVNAHRGHTPQQEASLKKLVGALQESFGIDRGRIFGHGELQSDRMSEEGKLARVLRGNAPPSSAPAVSGDFRSQVAAAAKAAGVPDALIPFAVAQAGLESGNGRSNLARTGNNLFGIKADPSWAGEKVTTKTTEVVNGQTVQVDAQFRKYGSLEESVKDWWAKIQRNYPETAAATSIEQAVDGLYRGRTGNYATLPKEEYLKRIQANAARSASLGSYGFQPAGGAQQSQPASDPSVSGDPANAEMLSPDAYQLRQVFFNIDGVQDKTHPLYSRTLRKQDAIANVKQLAMQSLNPDLLNAIPRSILTPTEREDISNWTLSIRKEIKSQEDAAWTQRARTQQLATEEATRMTNAALLRLQQGQDLSSEQRAEMMLKLNSIDPKLAVEFGERYNKIKSGRMDSSMEQEIYRDLEQQLYDTVNSRGDPTTVPLNRQTDPDLRMKLGDLARQLVKDGGELRESFYKNAYDKAMGSIFGMVGDGPSQRINSPGVYTFMMTSFNRFLIEEVGKFKQQTGVNNITADDQRSVIFNNALKRVLQAYPQEISGATAETVEKIQRDGVSPPGTPTATQNDLERKRIEESKKKFGFN